MEERVSSPWGWHTPFLKEFGDAKGPAIWVVDGPSGCMGSERVIEKLVDDKCFVITYSHRQQSKYENRTRIFTQDNMIGEGCYRGTMPNLRNCKLLIIDGYDCFHSRMHLWEYYVNKIREQGGIVLFFGDVSSDYELIWWVHKRATHTFDVPKRNTGPDKIERLKLLYK